MSNSFTTNSTRPKIPKAPISISQLNQLHSNTPPKRHSPSVPKKKSNSFSNSPPKDNQTFTSKFANRYSENETLNTSRTLFMEKSNLEESQSNSMLLQVLREMDLVLSSQNPVMASFSTPRGVVSLDTVLDNIRHRINSFNRNESTSFHTNPCTDILVSDLVCSVLANNIDEMKRDYSNLKSLYSESNKELHILISSDDTINNYGMNLEQCKRVLINTIVSSSMSTTNAPRSNGLVAQLSDQIEELKQHNTKDWNSKYEEMKKENETLKNTIQTLTDNINQKESTNKQLLADFQKEKDNITNAKDILYSNNIKLREQNKEYKQKFNTLKSEYAKLSKEHDDMSSQNRSLQTKLSQTNVSHETSSEMISIYQNQIQQNNKQLQDQSQEIAVLKSTYESLQSDHQKTKATFQTISDEIKDLQIQNANSRTELQKTTALLSEKTALLVKEQNINVESKSKLDQISSDKTQLQADYKALQADLLNMENAYKSKLKDMQRNITQQKENTKSINEQSEADLEACRLKIQQLELNNHNIQTEMEVQSHNFQSQLHDTSSVNNTLQKKIKKYENKIADLEQSIAEQKSIGNKSQTSIEDYKKQILENKEKIVTLINNLQSVQIQNQELSQQLSSSEKERQRRESEMSAELDEFKLSIGQYESDKQDLEGEIFALRDQLQNQNKDFQTKYNQISLEKSKVETQLKETNIDEKRLQSVTNRLQNQYNELQSSFCSLRNEYHDCAQSNEELKKTSIEYKKTIQALQVSLREQENLNEQLDLQLANIDIELANTKSQLLNQSTGSPSKNQLMQKKLDQILSANNELSSRCSSLEKENETLKSQHGNLMQTLQERSHNQNDSSSQLTHSCVKSEFQPISLIRDKAPMISQNNNPVHDSIELSSFEVAEIADSRMVLLEGELQLLREDTEAYQTTISSIFNLIQSLHVPSNIREKLSIYKPNYDDENMENLMKNLTIIFSFLDPNPTQHSDTEDSSSFDLSDEIITLKQQISSLESENHEYKTQIVHYNEILISKKEMDDRHNFQPQILQPVQINSPTSSIVKDLQNQLMGKEVDITQSTKQLEKVKNENSQLIQQLSENTIQMNKLKTQLLDIENNTTKSNKENTSLLQRIDELQSHNSKLESDLLEKEGLIKESEERIANYESQIPGIKLLQTKYEAQVKEVENQLSQKQTQYTILEKENYTLKSKVNDCTHEIDDLHDKLLSVSPHASDLYPDRHSNADVKAEYERKFDDLCGEITTNQSTIDSLLSNIDQLKQTDCQQKQEISKNKEEINTLHQRVEQYKALLDDSDNTLVDTQKNLTTVTNNEHIATRTNATLLDSSEEVVLLKSQIVELTKDILTKNDSIKQLEFQLSKTDIENARNDLLEKEIAQLKAENQSLHELLNNKPDETSFTPPVDEDKIFQLETEILKLQSDLDIKTSTVTRLQSSIKELKDTNYQHEQSIQTLNEQLEQLAGKFESRENDDKEILLSPDSEKNPLLQQPSQGKENSSQTDQTIEPQILEYQKQYDALNEQLKIKTAAVNLLLQNIRDFPVNPSIPALESENKKLQEQVLTRQNEIYDLQNTIKEQRQQIIEFENNNQDVNTNNLETQLKFLEERFTESKNIASNYELQMKEMQKALEHSNTIITNQSAQIKTLNDLCPHNSIDTSTSTYEWDERSLISDHETLNNENETQELRSEISELTNQLGSVKDELVKAHEHIVSLSNDLNQEIEQNKQLVTIREMVENQNEMLQEDMKKSTQFINEKNHQIQGFQQQVNETIAQKDDQINTLQDAISKSAKELTELKHKNSTLENEIVEKEGEISKLVDEIHNAKPTSSSVRTDEESQFITNRLAEITVLSKAMNETKETIEQLLVAQSTLQLQLNEQSKLTEKLSMKEEPVINELQTKTNELLQSIQQKDTKVAEYEKEIMKLESQLNIAQHENSTLQAEINCLHDALEKQKNTFQEMKDLLQTRLQDKDKEIGDLRDNIKLGNTIDTDQKLQEELTHSNSDNSTLSLQLQQQQINNQNLEQENSTLKEENSKFQQNNNQLLQTINELNEKIIGFNNQTDPLIQESASHPNLQPNVSIERFETVQMDNENLKQEILIRTEKYNDLSTQLETSNSTNSTMMLELTQIKQINSQLEDQISHSNDVFPQQVKESIDEYKSQIAQLENKINDDGTIISDLRNECDALKQKMCTKDEELEVSLNQTTEQTPDVEEKLSLLESQYHALQQELLSKEATLVELSKENDEWKKRNNKLDTAAIQKGCQIRELLEQNSNLGQKQRIFEEETEKQFLELQKDVDDAEKQKSFLEDENEKLNREKQHLIDELNEIKSQLINSQTTEIGCQKDIEVESSFSDNSDYSLDENSPNFQRHVVQLKNDTIALKGKLKKNQNYIAQMEKENLYLKNVNKTQQEKLERISLSNPHNPDDGEISPTDYPQSELIVLKNRITGLNTKCLSQTNIIQDYETKINTLTKQNVTNQLLIEELQSTTNELRGKLDSSSESDSTPMSSQRTKLLGEINVLHSKLQEKDQILAENQLTESSLRTTIKQMQISLDLKVNTISKQQQEIENNKIKFHNLEQINKKNEISSHNIQPCDQPQLEESPIVFDPIFQIFDYSSLLQPSLSLTYSSTGFHTLISENEKDQLQGKISELTEEIEQLKTDLSTNSMLVDSIDSYQNEMAQKHELLEETERLENRLDECTSEKYMLQIRLSDQEEDEKLYTETLLHLTQMIQYLEEELRQLIDWSTDPDALEKMNIKNAALQNDIDTLKVNVNTKKALIRPEFDEAAVFLEKLTEMKANANRVQLELDEKREEVKDLEIRIQKIMESASLFPMDALFEAKKKKRDLDKALAKILAEQLSVDEIVSTLKLEIIPDSDHIALIISKQSFISLLLLILKYYSIDELKLLFLSQKLYELDLQCVDINVYCDTIYEIFDDVSSRVHLPANKEYYTNEEFDMSIYVYNQMKNIKPFSQTDLTPFLSYLQSESDNQIDISHSKLEATIANDIVHELVDELINDPTIQNLFTEDTDSDSCGSVLDVLTENSHTLTEYQQLIGTIDSDIE